MKPDVEILRAIEELTRLRDSVPPSSPFASIQDDLARRMIIVEASTAIAALGWAMDVKDFRSPTEFIRIIDENVREPLPGERRNPG